MGAAVVVETIMGVLKMMVRNFQILVAVQGRFGYVHHAFMDDGQAPPAGLRILTVQRCASKCPSRKAQHKQHDNEKFVPVVHGSRV